MSLFDYLLNYYDKELKEEEVQPFQFDTILILNKVEDNYWNLIVIFPLVKNIEIIDSRRKSKNMEKEIHLLWKFLWHYCDFKNEKIYIGNADDLEIKISSRSSPS